MSNHLDMLRDMHVMHNIAGLQWLLCFSCVIAGLSVYWSVRMIRLFRSFRRFLTVEMRDINETLQG